MRVKVQIDGSTSPIDFERVVFVWKARGRRRIIGDQIEILVFAGDSLGTRFRCGARNSGSGRSVSLDNAILFDSADIWSRTSVAGGRGKNRVFSDSCSPCLILHQLCPLSAKIRQFIGSIECLEDVRLELERQLVFDLTWRGGISEETGFSCSNMVVHNSLCCSLAKQGNL
jgi:hypothetical protein